MEGERWLWKQLTQRS